MPAGMLQLVGQSTRSTFGGLNFSPYIDGQSPERSSRPISEKQIRARMAIIAPYTEWIRTYGVSGGLEMSGAIAHELKLKAAIGVWLGRDRAANDRQLQAGIDCAKAGHADMLIVGSETLLRGDLKTRQLCEYLKEARKEIPKSVPITTGDGYAQILGNAELVEHLDLVFYNDYSYWGGLPVEKAIARLDGHYSEMTVQAGEKPCWLSEHGWPDQGESVGAAEATPENAAAYMGEFLRWAKGRGVRAFYFEAFDEKWKSEHEGERGAHWGVWDSEGILKPHYRAIM